MSAPRVPRIKYRANPPLPHHRRTGRFARLEQDAISGAWAGDQFMVDTPNGRVDGRDGGSLDLDLDGFHEMTPDNVLRPPIV